MTEQEKREKVIKGLECIISSGNAGMRDDCANCIYPGGGDCLAPALRDALALLKAQEAKPVHVTAEINHRKVGECQNCGKVINSGDYPNYCGQCGQAVKWE